MSKAFNRLQSRVVRFHVSEPYSNTEETRARYILNFVSRETQRRFHSAMESLFMAPATLPIREVISASMEPSAEMIEPSYVNEGTNSTSSPSMFIRSCNFRRRGDHHGIGFSPADRHPVKMRNTDDRSSEKRGANSAISSA